MAKTDVFQEIELFQKLKANELTVPNDYTVEMGQLIKKAREEKGISQAQLAKDISRRQATVSDIETGKVEIGILTLVLLAIVLAKPLSYFFPRTFIKRNVFEVNTPMEEELLMEFKNLEEIGGADLALKQVKLIGEYFEVWRHAEETGYFDQSDEYENQ